MRQVQRRHILFDAAKSLTFATVLLCPPLAAQDAYPSRPIRIIVPYPAGPSGADNLARLLEDDIARWIRVVAASAIKAD